MKTTKTLAILVSALGLMVWQAQVSEAKPLATAFTFQGLLYDANHVADAQYDFQFKLYDDPNVILGNQIGSDVNIADVDVIDGYFTVELDFGSEFFDGNAVWLEIGVRPGEMNDANVYTTLSPRQDITPAPYALHTRWIFLGDDVTSVGIEAGHQNQGNYNTFVGRRAGYSNKTGYDNAFLGRYAGFSNTTGHDNTFVGSDAGFSNTTGFRNTFLGRYAGYANTTASRNTFLGYYAGYANTTGYKNTFLGFWAGRSNTTGYDNTFLGYLAGYANTAGCRNTFLGYRAGRSNITGHENTYLGHFAGYLNTTGDRNTFLGYYAGYANTTGEGNVFIGYQAGYNESGSDKLYIANGPADANVLIYGDFNTGQVGIGTTNPQRKLHMSDVIRLGPCSDFPSNPSDGDLCVVGESGSRDIYCYLNGDWRSLSIVNPP